MEHIEIVVRHIGGKKDGQHVGAQFILTAAESAQLREFVQKLNGPDAVHALLATLNRAA